MFRLARGRKRNDKDKKEIAGTVLHCFTFHDWPTFSLGHGSAAKVVGRSARGLAAGKVSVGIVDPPMIAGDNPHEVVQNRAKTQPFPPADKPTQLLWLDRWTTLVESTRTQPRTVDNERDGPMESTPNSEQYLTPAEVAETLPAGCSPQTVRRWIREGKLESVKVGGRYMVSLAALRKFLEDSAGASNKAGKAASRVVRARVAKREAIRLMYPSAKK